MDSINVNQPTSMKSLSNLFQDTNKFNHTILEATEGIFFVIHCYTGIILFISNTIKKVQKYETNWHGKNFYDQIHVADVYDVQKKLTSVMPTHSNNDESIRQSFTCRIKLNDSKEKEDYALVQFTGFIQNWFTNVKNNFSNFDSSTINKLTVARKVSTKNDLSIDSCFVAIAHIQHMSNDDIKDNIMKENTEFTSRHSIEGEFQFVNHIIYNILGYKISELLGSSLFDIIHEDDHLQMHCYLNTISNFKGDIFLETYRIRTINNEWICINVTGFAVFHPTTHRIEYINLIHNINKYNYDIDHFINHVVNNFFNSPPALKHQDSNRSMKPLTHTMRRMGVTSLTANDLMQQPYFTSCITNVMPKPRFTLHVSDKKMQPPRFAPRIADKQGRHLFFAPGVADEKMQNSRLATRTFMMQHPRFAQHVAYNVKQSPQFASRVLDYEMQYSLSVPRVANDTIQHPYFAPRNANGMMQCSRFVPRVGDNVIQHPRPVLRVSDETMQNQFFSPYNADGMMELQHLVSHVTDYTIQHPRFAPRVNDKQGQHLFFAPGVADKKMQNSRLAARVTDDTIQHLQFSPCDADRMIKLQHFAPCITDYKMERPRFAPRVSDQQVQHIFFAPGVADVKIQHPYPAPRAADEKIQHLSASIGERMQQPRFAHNMLRYPRFSSTFGDDTMQHLHIAPSAADERMQDLSITPSADDARMQDSLLAHKMQLLGIKSYDNATQ